MPQKNIFSWVKVFLWCGAIYFMSSRPDFGPAIELDTWYGAFQLASRKFAHLFEYAVLLTLVLQSVRGSWPQYWRWHFLASFLFVLVYAISDEWHQTFVFGRTGTIRDVFIDSIGALMGFYYDLKHEKKKAVTAQNPAVLEDQARHES